MQRKSFLIGASLLLSACARRESAARFQLLTSGDEPLRSKFNEDAGKVRILMLVSPT
jgi:hypothetical protein